VAIPDDRDPDVLEEELHRVEHELLPEAIRLIAAGKVSVDPANPRVVTTARER
jgi:phosphoribosylglycinamide formyltransferase-1